MTAAAKPRPMLAYAVLETGENTGGIVFAQHAIVARRRGSCEYADGDIASVTCRRAPWADPFASLGAVEASAAVAHGWRFECHGCGMNIDEYSLSDDGKDVDGVIGTMDSLVFCCSACRVAHVAQENRKKAFGEAFLDILRAIVRKRFGTVIFTDDEPSWKPHLYIGEDDGSPYVCGASLHFHLPGEQIAPASIHYHHDHGRYAIGPQPVEYRCCASDRAAFEAFAAATKTRTL